MCISYTQPTEYRSLETQHPVEYQWFTFVILWMIASLWTVAAIMGGYYMAYCKLGKDKNSKYEVRFLLKAYCFHYIINWVVSISNGLWEKQIYTIPDFLQVLTNDTVLKQ
jgi:hypothetical protein